MIKGIRHTGIVVTDMERAQAFYHDLMGLKTVKDFEEKGDYIDSISGLSGVHLHMVKLIAEDGTMVELLHYLSHPGEVPVNSLVCNIGCSHVAFTVDDIDKEYARLLKNGVRFNCAPYVSPDGYAKVAFCCDPDGTYIELVEEL